MDMASIREWVEFSEQNSKIPTKNELILADLEQEAIQISEHPASLPIQELSKSLTRSELTTQELTETVANTISSMETNPFESIPKEEQHALNVATQALLNKLPPAKIYASELTATINRPPSCLAA